MSLEVEDDKSKPVIIELLDKAKEKDTGIKRFLKKKLRPK